MDLYLIRHFQAARVGEGDVREDAERPLSADGRRTALRVGEKLRELGSVFDRVASSPLMRAVQTAEILACAVEYRGPLDSCPFLARTGRWKEELEGFLQGLARADPAPSSVVLVGHNPDLSDMASAFLRIPEGAFPFPAGAVCRLELRKRSLAPRAKLRWWLDPAELRTHESIGPVGSAPR